MALPSPSRHLYFIQTLMGAFGPASESLRLAERYRQMTDDELLDIAAHSSELTDPAKQALAQEMSTRKLKLPDPAPIPPMEPETQESEDAYSEDRRPVDLCTVWSSRDALKVQNLLDQAEIPFFIGPEKATRAEAVTSNFTAGLTVQVMQIGLPWAQQALQHYEPADEPPKQGPSEGILAVHCPKCHSEDVVFETLVEGPAGQPSAEKYAWECASCGNHWVDDGVETRD